MHITRYTDYSLRVLMYLGLKNEKLSTIGEIAEHYGISKNHLMKVVQELSNKEYVVAIRGKNGGLRLNGEPRNVNIGALVRDIEQHFELVECFSENNSCVIAPVCQLKRLLSEALDGFLQVLDRYTLADLLPQADIPELTQLLQIVDTPATGESTTTDCGCLNDP